MDNTKDPVRVLREALEQIFLNARMDTENGKRLYKIASDALSATDTAAIPHSEQRETVAAGEVKPVGHFRLFNGWYLQLDPKCWPDGDESTTPLYATPVAAPVPEAAGNPYKNDQGQVCLPSGVTMRGTPTGIEYWHEGKLMWKDAPVPEAKAEQVGDDTLQSDTEMVLAEVRQARANWPGFNSAHEGYAVLSEEVDELWAHVKTNQKRRDLPAMKKEAMQVAAMALRFMGECCDETIGRK